MLSSVFLYFNIIKLFFVSLVKRIVKSLIPFYSSYIKSLSSTIHNQSYLNYVRFRLTGKCSNWGGGTILPIPRVLLPIQEKFMWDVIHLWQDQDVTYRELELSVLEITSN